jgi:N-carbamoyl-D-amino-acid hydrolase
MSRILTVGAAQLGPIARNDTREAVVTRQMELMRQAHAMDCDLIVYPELALTSFFPRWWMEDQEEIDSFFEHEMPSRDTMPLFEEARRCRMGFYLGFAERIVEDQQVRHYNASIIVDQEGRILGKYRKVHLPGHADHRPHYPFQHLEKRYFDVGNLGFRAWRGFGGVVGMCICNDRRWPETYRVLGLQGVELIMLGYNTPSHVPWMPVYDHLTGFHNHLVMQSGAYQNSSFVVGVAKAGSEEGCDLAGGSCIIAPSGEIIAQAVSKTDELIVARCDLDLALENKRGVLNFANREPQHYKLITEQRTAVLPE